jgi:hypothetical protein
MHSSALQQHADPLRSYKALAHKAVCIALNIVYTKKVCVSGGSAGGSTDSMHHLLAAQMCHRVQQVSVASYALVLHAALTSYGALPVPSQNIK